MPPSVMVFIRVRARRVLCVVACAGRQTRVQTVELYAKDRNVFYADFAGAFGKLLALGCA
ncbi:hypothetical protein FOA52_010238 [Chlamydomonas sp. UWO 241]|nr:hypothetical protein FOA52_010238 [Chlamydomonas sp. UWO 241]